MVPVRALAPRALLLAHARRRLRANPRRTLLRRHAQACFAARGPLLLGSERADALAEELEEPVGVDADADVRVRLVPGPAPEVDDRAAAAELRLAVDVDVAVHASRRSRAGGPARPRPRRGSARPRCRTCAGGTRRRSRRARRRAGRRRRTPRSRSACASRHQRLVGDVEPDHRHGQAAPEDAPGRLRVDVDVELGRRRDVSLGDRAAHDHDALDVLRRLRVPGQEERDVRERPTGTSVTGAVASRGCARRGSRPRAARPGRPAARGSVGAVEAGLAVDVGGDEELAGERPIGARRDRARRPGRRTRGRAARSRSSSSSVWLPATVVTPSRSSSGLASASRSAIASSWPGSQSSRIGVGAHCRAGPEVSRLTSRTDGERAASTRLRRPGATAAHRPSASPRPRRRAGAPPRARGPRAARRRGRR